MSSPPRALCDLFSFPLPPLQPEFINLCFWFVPPSLRGRESCPDYWSSLGKVGAGSTGILGGVIPNPLPPQPLCVCVPLHRWPPPSKRG